ncbi:hypothetical protein RHGRI_017802 [Rhododendron griersonianum]|uniref:Uncharacterized protein n=1 Tax=Rhododendron griersonianum TaxID=479676 RepID=A0AAV6JZ31_9ERIC|nr:hypothetical protein RHGRI_017802 [Rhododendron griersonianum]
MSSTSRAWIAAASVGAVEALKDQGFCRWNYTMRSVHHHAKASLRSFSQANNLSSPSPAAAASASRVRGGEEAKQSEESLRKVMDQVEVGKILRVGFLDPECPCPALDNLNRQLVEPEADIEARKRPPEDRPMHSCWGRTCYR